METHAPRQKSTVLADMVVVAVLLVLAFHLNRWMPGPERQPARIRSGDVHSERAKERGRGRDATSVLAVPWRGWKDILWRTYTQFTEDRLLSVAAGVAFFVLLAIFPGITALVSIYGLIADPATIGQQLSILKGIIPTGAFDIVSEQVNRIAETSSGSLSFAFVSGLLVATWSTNAGVKAIIDALNVIYEQKERRSFVRLTLVSLAFTIGGLAVLIAALGAIVILPLVLAVIGFGSVAGQVIALVRWPALFVLILVGLAIIYRYGPHRRPPKWRWVMVGSVFATVAWLGGSALFSWYLSNFANYDATYGSLGAAIGLMMWLWVAFVVILFGAELNAEIEHQTACDSTVGRGKPLGSRSAVMADTVGESQG